MTSLRIALRSLLRAPVFSAVAILSLALGIGANAGIFTLIERMLLHPLPVDHPYQLTQLVEQGQWYGSNNGDNALSYPMYDDLRRRNQVFSGMFCTYFLPYSVSFSCCNEHVPGELVSGSYFSVLGVRPHLGRLFTEQDDRRGAAPIAILSYAYWQNRFGSDPSIVGKDLLIHDRRFTIVGVSQPGFEGVQALFHISIFVPVSMAEELTGKINPFENRRHRWIQVFGRLKPGVSLTQAKASLAPLFHSILEMEVQQKEFARATPYRRQQFLRVTLNVLSGSGGQDVARQFLEAPIWAMMALVGLVLLIACANVANLMIARSAARQREIAIRLAIGAGRARIVRQLLLESSVLALIGGVLGLALSPWAMRFMLSIIPDIDPPLTISSDPDLTVVFFTLAISLLTALVFGLAPALQATRPDLAPVLKDQAGSLAGAGQARWRKALVVAQMSLSLLLLIAAGLFAGSLKNLKDLNPGFDVNHLLTFSVDAQLNGYTPDRARLFYRQLDDSLASLPSVSAAALCVVGPLTFNEWDSSIAVEGYVPKPGEDMNPRVNYVSPGFFTALKIDLYAGREFDARDIAGAPKVAIVNQRFAQHYFGDRGAVGRHIGLGSDPGAKTDLEIVGVVRDTRASRMDEDWQRQVYFPYLQDTGYAPSMIAYVRTPLGPDQMFPAIRAAVAKLDPHLPITLMKTEEKQRDDSMAVERLSATLSSSFGVLATLLASIGLYGVMAFLVARRTKEIGIRMALGASSGDVIWMVMREVLILAGAGVAIGLPAALAVAHLLQRQLYGIQPNDPFVAAGATLGLVAVAAISGYIPARRATRVHPTQALRYE